VYRFLSYAIDLRRPNCKHGLMHYFRFIAVVPHAADATESDDTAADDDPAGVVVHVYRNCTSLTWSRR